MLLQGRPTPKSPAPQAPRRKPEFPRQVDRRRDLALALSGLAGFFKRHSRTLAQPSETEGELLDSRRHESLLCGSIALADDCEDAPRLGDAVEVVFTAIFEPKL
jgi:hypothetical protein